MKHENIKIGDYVVYIPDHLLVGDKTQIVKGKNLGVVTSKNNHYIFVRYPMNGSTPQATRSEDLFTLRNRNDLIEKLELMLKTA